MKHAEIDYSTQPSVKKSCLCPTTIIKTTNKKNNNTADGMDTRRDTQQLIFLIYFRIHKKPVCLIHLLISAHSTKKQATNTGKRASPFLPFFISFCVDGSPTHRWVYGGISFTDAFIPSHGWKDQGFEFIHI